VSAAVRQQICIGNNSSAALLPRRVRAVLQPRSCKHPLSDQVQGLPSNMTTLMLAMHVYVAECQKDTHAALRLGTSIASTCPSMRLSVHESVQAYIQSDPCV